MCLNYFLVFGGNEPDLQSFGCHLVTDKMEIDFNVLGAGMEHGIGSKVGSSKIVTP
jgi:hypothetical protein